MNSNAILDLVKVILEITEPLPKDRLDGGPHIHPDFYPCLPGCPEYGGTVESDGFDHNRVAMSPDVDRGPHPEVNGMWVEDQFVSKEPGGYVKEEHKAYEPAPILRYFEYAHLPVFLAAVSMHFHNLAHQVDRDLPGGPEKSTTLRKLLEAKDAAVRAALDLSNGI